MMYMPLGLNLDVLLVLLEANYVDNLRSTAVVTPKKKKKEGAGESLRN
jgi:hypothetical protein